MTYSPAAGRYESMEYRRCGTTGLMLPAISLGLWHNFGAVDDFETARATVLRAFDLGVTHFDLANNYGPPPGSAEETFGRILREDLRSHRDEIVVSTKAGWKMWDGPYGDWGSRKYLVASLDASLGRLGLDYVDIYYHHRPDPVTPVAESMGALDHLVRRGKALYAGVSQYRAEATRAAAECLRRLGTPLAVHQPSYSMLDRWVETGALLGALEREGAGCVAFSILRQGILTGKYLDGVPAGSRASKPHAFLKPSHLTEEILGRVRRLAAIARAGGRTLAETAILWVLRDRRVTTALLGASSAAQVEENVRVLSRPPLASDELAAIEEALA